VAVVRTHRPVWRSEACLPCGACTRRCPSGVFVEQRLESDSLRGRVARAVEFPEGDRPAVPPCQAACPLGQDVPAYNTALRSGDFDAAAQVIYRANPLPSVCGRLCVRPCESACVRAALDQPVAIRSLKRAAIEHAGGRSLRPPKKETAVRVVVIGAGPAGLSCAFYLRRLGFSVRVLEAEAKPGGLLRFGVPAFDLPRQVLAAEIEALAELGIEIVCDARVDSAHQIQQLLSDGARAVVLATGAACGVPAGLPGEDLPGCFDGIAFAHRYADGDGPPLCGPAVVSGAGHMAVAAARMALRAGADPVHLLMRRSLAEAPADGDQIRQAIEEGVRLVEEHRALAISGQGRIQGVEISPIVYGPPDGVGRRWPLSGSDANLSSRTLEAATFVAAETRKADLAWLADAPSLRAGPGGGMRTADGGFMTDLPGLFVAGDLLTGPRNAVEAIATAMRVAAAVALFCRGGAA
jgi:NADPH-dependent glutamate synthase beta subunit-like oxidoreductase